MVVPEERYTRQELSGLLASREVGIQELPSLGTDSDIIDNQKNGLISQQIGANQIEAKSEIQSDEVGTEQATPCSVDECVSPGEPVTLSFVCSNPDPRVQVQCIMVSGPQGATFSSPIGNPVTGTFTWIAGEDGQYQASFQAVTVFCPSDITCRNSEVLTKVILVSSNQPPIVDAGADQTVSPGKQVQLRASASDPEDDPMTFEWIQLEIQPNTEVTLSDRESLNPTFTAPNVPGAVLTFQFAANDGVNSGVAITHIKIEGNKPPKANAGDDRTISRDAILSGTRTSFNGCASSDPEGNKLKYSWSLVKPHPNLNAPSTLPDVCNPDVPITLTAADDDFSTQLTYNLVVNDGIQNSDPDSVNLTVCPIYRMKLMHKTKLVSR